MRLIENFKTKKIVLGVKEKGVEMIHTIVGVGLVVIVVAAVILFFGKGKDVFNKAQTETIDGKTTQEILSDPADALKLGEGK